eukprot:CAMPEP_0196658378 /NCGR_PEP_ID=MMETSP1086-20130531/29470_1 /TAXON_ID=77921 /ORGANISM="Cyanoptyche  gloeocystis , Strain SAG4.97" /LENGTH=116 /DNA_ID=CAMNT_0041991929 /DNA_START=365 /DNA_END=718 /DNA_ORIENTATION=-
MRRQGRAIAKIGGARRVTLVVASAASLCLSLEASKPMQSPIGAVMYCTSKKSKNTKLGLRRRSLRGADVTQYESCRDVAANEVCKLGRSRRAASFILSSTHISRGILGYEDDQYVL